MICSLIEFLCHTASLEKAQKAYIPDLYTIPIISTAFCEDILCKTLPNGSVGFNISRRYLLSSTLVILCFLNNVCTLINSSLYKLLFRFIQIFF